MDAMNRDNHQTALQLKCMQFAFDHAADAIFWLNSTGQFIYVNHTACSSLGYSRAEMLTMTVHDIDPHFPPETWPAHWEAMRQTGAKTIESEHIAKDRTVIPIEIRINHLEFEGLEFHCAFVRSIAERRKQENILHESEKRLRLIMDATSDGMWDRNLTTDSTYYGKNWAKSLGYTENEFKEMNISWKELLHPDDRKRAIAAVNDHLAGKTTRYIAEFRLRNKSGEWNWFLGKGKVVEWDAANKPLRFVGTHTNIMERKKAEDKLVKQSEQAKLFAYSVAHDLKSPAIAIHGLADRFQQKFKTLSDDKKLLYCNQLLQSSEQIVKLVEKINLYIAAKESPLFIEEVSLQEVIRIIQEEFFSRLQIRDITMTAPADLPVIRADRISLLRIFRNLIDNALKYGGTELSEVTIKHQENDEFHVFSVLDDGVGVTKEESPSLFGFFKRRPTSVGIIGAGLGLAIVKDLTTQHKGTVWTEHCHRKGITFCFSIAKSL